MREYLQSGKPRWKMGKSREYRFKRSIFSASHVSLQEDKNLGFSTDLIWCGFCFQISQAQVLPWMAGRQEQFFFWESLRHEGIDSPMAICSWKNAKEHKISRRRTSHFCATWTSGMKIGLTWLVLYSLVLMGRSFGAGLEGPPKTSESETSKIKKNSWWLEDEFNLVRVWPGARYLYGGCFDIRCSLKLRGIWLKNRPGSQQKCWASSEWFKWKMDKSGTSPIESFERFFFPHWSKKKLRCLGCPRGKFSLGCPRLLSSKTTKRLPKWQTYCW